MTTIGILSLLCFFPVATQDQNRTAVDIDGVWSVTSIHEDGHEQALEKNPKPDEVESWRYEELVVCQDRLIIINTDGSSMACKIKLVAKNPQHKFAVTTGYCHDKTGETTYMIVSRDKDKLTIAWVPSDATKIDATSGAKQIVITAQR